MRPAPLLTARLLTLTFGPWAPAALPAEPPSPAADSEESRGEAVRVYRNEDLPEPLPVASTVTAQGSTERVALPESTMHEASPVTVLVEKEWRARAAALRLRLRQAERNEWTYRSFLACAEDGVEISGPDCAPRINRVNRVRVGFTRDPTEPRLRRQLAKERDRLAELEAEWSELEREARWYGVPPEWLEEGADDPAPRRPSFSP